MKKSFRLFLTTVSALTLTAIVLVAFGTSVVSAEWFTWPSASILDRSTFDQIIIQYTAITGTVSINACNNQTMTGTLDETGVVTFAMGTCRSFQPLPSGTDVVNLSHWNQISDDYWYAWPQVTIANRSTASQVILYYSGMTTNTTSVNINICNNQAMTGTLDSTGVVTFTMGTCRWFEPLPNYAEVNNQSRWVSATPSQ